MMKRLILITVLACLIPVAAAGADPFPSPQIHPGTPNYVPGQVIVKFRAGADSVERAHALKARRAGTLRALPLAGMRVVHIPAGENVRQAAASLAADPAVAWAQPDSYQQVGWLPNDPMLGQQWALDNTGQTLKGVAGTPGADIHIAQAWERTTGSPSVRVAVVDTGISSGPPDLAPNIAPGGWDFVQDDNDPSDAYGHGTFVAGIIGAKGNNGIGVAGVDWNASILPVRVLSNLGVGTCSDIAAGMTYAADHGARVVNISIRGYDPCQAEADAMAAAPGTLFVTIAGNEAVDTGSYPTDPCTYSAPNNICVAATDQNDQLADFSNYGPGVDLAAPGKNIESTWMRWLPNQTYLPDSFETSLPGRWNAGGSPNTWDRTIQNPLSGVFSLTDSPFANYPNNAYNYVDRTFDMRNMSDCSGHASVQTALGAGDYLLGQNLPDGVTSVESTALSGTSPGYEETWFDMAPLEGHSNGHFRFSLLSDASGVGDGVYIDDFSIVCAPPVTSYTGAADEFEVGDGTSFAAPYVTGVAALVLSVDPSLTPAQVKQRILSTVDPLPSLAGKVASGGRLDAARAVGLPVADGPPSSPAGPGSGTSPSHASFPALARDLATLRNGLRRMGLRALLRRGGFAGVVHAGSAGRYAITLRGKRSLVIASGSRATRRAGSASVKVLLTGRGRRMLKSSKRVPASLTIRFDPSSGGRTSRSASVLLR